MTSTLRWGFTLNESVSQLKHENMEPDFQRKEFKLLEMFLFKSSALVKLSKSISLNGFWHILLQMGTKSSVLFLNNSALKRFANRREKWVKTMDGWRIDGWFSSKYFQCKTTEWMFCCIFRVVCSLFFFLIIIICPPSTPYLFKQTAV